MDLLVEFVLIFQNELEDVGLRDDPENMVPVIYDRCTGDIVQSHLDNRLPHSIGRLDRYDLRGHQIPNP